MIKKGLKHLKKQKFIITFIKDSYEIIHELIEIPKIDIERRIDFVESYII